jgi:hypothetical protein
MTTGALMLRYITLWHNSSSKGPIITRTGGVGIISLEVCYSVIFFILYWNVEIL